MITIVPIGGYLGASAASAGYRERDWPGTSFAARMPASISAAWTEREPGPRVRIVGVASGCRAGDSGPIAPMAPIAAAPDKGQEPVNTMTRNDRPAAMRASDADRDAVVSDLSEHFQAGRLTAGEFDDRTGQALTARTLA
jgi:hypothetical protein